MVIFILQIIFKYFYYHAIGTNALYILYMIYTIVFYTKRYYNKFSLRAYVIDVIICTTSKQTDSLIQVLKIYFFVLFLKNSC